MILALDLATSTGFAHGDGASRPVVSTVRMPSTGQDVGEFLSFFRRWFRPTVDRLLALVVAENDARAIRNQEARDKLGPQAPQEDELELLVIYEAPTLPPAQVEQDSKGRWKAKMQTTIHTTRKLQGLAAVVELEVYDLAQAGWPIYCREVPLQTVKKELGGSGRAGKADMVFAARRAGIEIASGDEGEDEADAFGVFLVGVKYHAPQHFARWLALINGGRGTLV
jgi:hypothetical protein